MSKQVEVPEGLIGAAGAESMRQHHFRPNDEITRTIIEVAFEHFSDRLLSDEAVEAAARDRWERHWTDPQGMADWEEAKRRGMPGPAGMLRETHADLTAALQAASIPTTSDGEG